MDLSRRELAVASAVALAVPGLLLSGFSNAEASADEAAVSENVEVLRKAILEADKSKLDQVASGQISYGHSDGRVETKDQFINGVMTRKQTVKSLAFPDLKVAVVGNAASASHLPGRIRARGQGDDHQDRRTPGLAKQEGAWKLLARQVQAARLRRRAATRA